MADYIEKLKSDLLEQFKGKLNIEALVEVIGKQFNDVSVFYEQLSEERSLSNPKTVGQQLDGIGDIVVLTREDATKMDGKVQIADLTDEGYRKYLIYKILRNTSNCTYADIMRAIGMFWDGPPLKYTEDPDHPATMIFDFEAGTDLADQAIGIPFVKAGGVGLYMRMHKSEDTKVYFGLALRRSSRTLYGCNVPKLEQYTYLADETDVILMDEFGNWLVV